MYTIGVRSRYEAAHSLRGYPGPCSRLHGHSYEVEAVLRFEALDEAGISYDFMRADAHLQAITAGLDHSHLNELPAFREVETTAENQARHIYRELKQRMGEDGRHLASIRVWEGPNHWAEYAEPGAD